MTRSNCWTGSCTRWRPLATRALTLGGGDRVLVQAQASFRLDPFSSPEPDIAALTFRDDYYRAGGVGPGDVLLLVEVADSSETHDRQVKLPLYARAGIPEVWIVTREPAAIEVYLEPGGDRYRQLRTYLRGETVSPSL